jgi:hypothetical protein
MGPRDKFQKLIDELLGFPYGLKDTINALAYMLEIRPGEPVHPSFGNAHAVNGFQPAPQAVPCLLFNRQHPARTFSAAAIRPLDMRNSAG